MQNIFFIKLNLNLILINTQMFELITFLIRKAI